MATNDDIHTYEGLLLSSTSSNKRSLTNHFVDYVKRTKSIVPPCKLSSPVKLTIDQTPKTKLAPPPSSTSSKSQHPKRGSLCIAYSISNDDHNGNVILSLHVVRARQLAISETDRMNTFVKITYPHQYEQSSKIIHGTNSPVFDEKFHIPLNKNNLSTPSKRLTISVYNQSISNNRSDLIGCMSFNMKTLLKTTSCTKNSSKYKWYCLLPESIGKHKRMALNVEHSTKKLSNNKKSNSNGLILNVEIFDRDEIHFSSGYPCTISEVKSAIGSSTTRPMPGDVLLQVNDINVSRTQAKAVKKLIKSLPLPINLQLYRRSTSTTVATPSSSIKIDKIVLNSVDQHEPLNRVLFSQSEKPTNSKIPLNLDYQQSLLMSPINHRKISEQSDGSESGVGSESNPYSDQENRLETISQSYEREVLHLIDIQKEFINQIELGVQFYSRPLKHYLISSSEHGKLFQNIEKILAISRYQLNRLQTLADRTIFTHIGKIFHENVQLLSDAFNHYIAGYSNACLQLKQLLKCASFQRFIQNNQTNLFIEQFLQLPLNYIDNLANQLDILCCTCEYATDANYLLHVLKELRQCSLHITSIESSTSQNHCSTTMSLNSASGTSSMMNQTEDNDIIELQNRLQFTKDIRPVVLTGRNRHVIFSGVLLLQNENKTYIETWAILLNDMILFTQRNAIDTRLTLITNAISLSDIVDFRSSEERQDALIFLSNKPTSPYKIRYPSKCLQYAWQTILEQRLKTWQRSIHDDSESADSDFE